MDSSEKSSVSAQRIVIPNRHREARWSASRNWARSREVLVSWDNQTMNNIAATIEKEGISAFRLISLGMERVKAVSITATITMKLMIYVLLSNTSLTWTVWFLLFSATVKEVMWSSSMRPKSVLGEDFLERIKQQGFIDVKDGKSGNRVTEESLMERLYTEMHEACLKIDKECRVDDEVIPVEDAREFAKIIPNHKLEIVEGADHCYTKHQSQFVATVTEFKKTVIVKNN
ncbi:alpha/beta-Hydrolases superfamily protein [Raphanus sativus]|nr:alpha/beta-Hydrolases superfamily protein [Raphanus sativus]